MASRLLARSAFGYDHDPLVDELFAAPLRQAAGAKTEVGAATSAASSKARTIRRLDAGDPGELKAVPALASVRFASRHLLGTYARTTRISAPLTSAASGSRIM